MSIALLYLELEATHHVKRVVACITSAGTWLLEEASCMDVLEASVEVTLDTGEVAWLERSEDGSEWHLRPLSDDMTLSSKADYAIFRPDGVGVEEPMPLMSGCQHVKEQGVLDDLAAQPLDAEVFSRFEAFDEPLFAPLLAAIERGEVSLELGGVDDRETLVGEFDNMPGAERLIEGELIWDDALNVPADRVKVLMIQRNHEPIEPLVLVIMAGYFDLNVWEEAGYEVDGWVEFASDVELTRRHLADYEYLGVPIGWGTVCGDLDGDGTLEIDLWAGGDGGYYQHLMGFDDHGAFQPLGPAYFWGP